MISAYLVAAIILVGHVTAAGAHIPPDTLWTRVYGGPAFDAGTTIKKTSDGGFIVAGSTESFGSGGSDAWLVKLNGDGTMAWSRVFGGAGDDHAGAVDQTHDGGYIFAGLSKSFGNGSEDVWLLKTDASGDSLWDKVFGGPEDDRPHSVRAVSDGGFIIAGGTGNWTASNQDAWLIRTDSIGNVIWDETYGGAGNEKAYYAQQTSDGGFVLAGYTNSFGSGSYDMWILKTNATGDSLWSATFGGAAFDNAYNMKQTADGGYVLAGYTRSFGSGGQDVWLVKTDEYGVQEWSKIFGQSGDEVTYGVHQTARGNYILAGLTNSFGAVNFDGLLIKTDPDGNEIWKSTYGGTGNDHFFSVDQADDGGYVAVGYSNSFGLPQDDDLYAVRLASDEPNVAATVTSYSARWTGVCVEIDWCLTEHKGRVSFDVYRRQSSGGRAVRINGELVTASSPRYKFRDRRAVRGNNYIYRVDVIEGGGVATSFETSVATPPLAVALRPNSPNPFRASTRIDFTVHKNQRVTLEIFDAAGKFVRTLVDGVVPPGDHTVRWNGCDSAGATAASGIYFVKLTAGKEILTRKTTLLR